MKVICRKQDLSYLSWTKIRNSSGTAGSFLKAYTDFGGDKVYYKLSNYDSYKGIVGHECVNEIIVDRLLSILGIEHLEYELVHADVLIDNKTYDTYVCSSGDFKKRGENKVALDAFYQSERMKDETPLEFCIRNGWEQYIYEMLVVDFLILNRDRHGANIEVLRDSKNKKIRLAPLFDHGLSLLFQCTDGVMVSQIDVMEDKRVQCFVGTNSTLENLNLIPRNRFPKLNPLKQKDREFIFRDLDGILSTDLQDKIWEMLWRRWNYYEDFCNQRRE